MHTTARAHAQSTDDGSMRTDVTIKVMIIDDSNTIRRSAELFLRQAGYDVILAEDGFDALAKISSRLEH